MSEELDVGALVGGRYRVLKRLGQGGMGMVFLANVEGPAGFEKLVALKVLHPHVAHDVEAKEMFLTEARLSAQLSHANIAQIYDLGEADGLYYLAMEYVRGRDLRALLRAVDEREGRIPLELCVFIVSKLCEALEHAHTLRDRAGNPLKLVHRDVTPVNCLLGYSGDVKLIDFGIAKAANVASRTMAGMIRGKVVYMSPEQTRGHALDRRSDLFALGIILYELLIGARPFDLDDDNEILLIDRIRAGEHPRAAELDPELPPALDRIVEKALTVDRDRRYQSAAEMQEDLQRFLMAQQLHVTSRDLGAFLVEMVGVDSARADGAAPAELTAQTGLKRTPEGKSELRSRVITQPDRDRVEIEQETKESARGPAKAKAMPSGPGATTSDGETREHESPPATERGRPLVHPAVAGRTEAELAPVGDDTRIVREPLSSTERVPPVERPRRSGPMPATTPARPSASRPAASPHLARTDFEAPAAVRREVVARATTEPRGAPAHAVDSPTAPPSRSGVETLRGPRERRGVGLVVPAIVLVCVALGGAAAWWWTSREPPRGVEEPPVVAPVPPVVTPAPPPVMDAGALAVALPPPVEPTPAVVEPPPPAVGPVVDAGVAVAVAPELGPKATPKKDERRAVPPLTPRPGAKPATPEPDVKPRPLPVVSAFITVRANQPSEVFIDGASIGQTPRVRAPVSPGHHVVRVDCLLAGGRETGKPKELDLPAWAEAVVQHECVEKKP